MLPDDGPEGFVNPVCSWDGIRHDLGKGTFLPPFNRLEGFLRFFFPGVVPVQQFLHRDILNGDSEPV